MLGTLVWHFIQRCRGASELQPDICLFKFNDASLEERFAKSKTSRAGHYEKQ
jgi:hypothetical protein